MEAIYAVDIKNGLSKDGKIPWTSKKDLKFFVNKTKNNVVIMGRTTYFSLPEDLRPLRDRLNIVLTNNPSQYKYLLVNTKNLFFTDYHNIHNALIMDKYNVIENHPYLNLNFKIFFIGGKTIYEKYMHLCDRIWITRIKKDYHCDLFLHYHYPKIFYEKKTIENDEELEIIVYEKKGNANVP